MRVFLGLVLATLINFLLGIIGFEIVNNSFLSSYAPKIYIDLSSINYLTSFLFKFLVIALLSWIMYRVMPLLDKPKKRVLFIFILGSAFSFYNEINLFWTYSNWFWSATIVTGESLNWLVTAYVLSKFLRPNHLGAQ
tara:strand:+ start:908 stop:1318 length:411 start_codon:yes stop_codon:yes gene_type:complete